MPAVAPNSTGPRAVRVTLSESLVYSVGADINGLDSEEWHYLVVVSR